MRGFSGMISTADVEVRSLDNWLTQFQGYASKYFIVNGFRMEGPLVAYPNMVTYWNTGKTVEDITPESLSFLEPIASELEVLIIGTGKSTEMLSEETIAWLEERNIGFDAVPSMTACAQFNFMSEEYRRVVACILPVAISFILEINHVVNVTCELAGADTL